MAVVISWTKTPKWSSSDDGTVLGGADLGNLQTDIEGHSHSGIATLLSELNDVALTSVAQGNILYRGATYWNNLAPGTAGHFLKTQGAGANPAWTNTFDIIPILPASDPTTDNQASRKKYVDGLIAAKAYDSGWFAVSNNTAYTKTHSLGTTKVLTTVYVSDNADGSGKCAISQDNSANNEACGIFPTSLSTTVIAIRTGVGYIFNGLNADGTTWTAVTGYARIVMLALE